MNIPSSTYRLQFHNGFTFQDANLTLKYLNKLGISSIYASPIFKAKKDSTHGYDVVDPNSINPQLGTVEDFNSLIKSTHEIGMGWIQDIVPNHMSFSSENPWLYDILEKGSMSDFIDYFDIEWNHPYKNMKGKLLAPFLGTFYSDALEKGNIKLELSEFGFSIRYFEHTFPVNLESYSLIFEHILKKHTSLTSNESSFLNEFLIKVNNLKNMHDQISKKEYSKQAILIKKTLLDIYKNKPEIVEILNQGLAKINGIIDNSESFNFLDHLLSKQYFRLSYWKVASEEINFRRFFTINDLICTRMEKEHVFRHSHEFILKQIEDGKFDGLRIDHLDGLYDPLKYLKMLRVHTGETYIIAEKILDQFENLQSSMPVEGTTGYDFLNWNNALFIQTQNNWLLSRIYYKFAKLRIPYRKLLAKKKRIIIGKHLAGNIDNLALHLKNISANDRTGNDITLYALRRALVEVLVNFPVYRTYISQDHFESPDHLVLRKAINLSSNSHPELFHEFNFIEKFFFLKNEADTPDKKKNEWINFIMHLQQFTSALMAKGVEDTFFYNYNRLLSVNEVGGNPEHAGCDINEFNNYIFKRLESFPHAINASATHDTKRGEDVRARINVLSEIPIEWESAIKMWNRIVNRKRRKIKGTHVPDSNDIYFLYQTLVGTFPFFLKGSNYVNRLKCYIIKAVREAKVHTEWIKPDTEYEKAYIDFVENILKNKKFMKYFLSFQKKVAFYGALNSISQSIMKMTSPGIPDFYQGSELWDLCMVDPDNRRPVDFELRNKILDSFHNQMGDIHSLLEKLMKNYKNGHIKLFIIYKILNFRKSESMLFQKGQYIPLNPEGEKKDNLICFKREYESKNIIVITPRFFTSLVKFTDFRSEKNVWKDTLVRIPDSGSNLFTNILTDDKFIFEKTIKISELFKDFPFAVLFKS